MHFLYEQLDVNFVELKLLISWIMEMATMGLLSISRNQNSNSCNLKTIDYSSSASSLVLPLSCFALFVSLS